jgi:predicted nucleic acid-binding protein
MMSKHVLVETNWIVDVAAPSLSRNRDAAALHDSARRGDVILHVPAICLVEARKVVRERRPRADLEAIRSFIRDRKGNGDIDEPTADAAFEVLSRFQQHVMNERAQAPQRIADLAADGSINVFPLDETMLARSTELASETALDLKPFDLSILAAVLTHGAMLRAQGHEVSFCTLDGDLQPWDRNGRRIDLADLFDTAGIWVFGDFLMQTPPRPIN